MDTLDLDDYPAFDSISFSSRAREAALWDAAAGASRPFSYGSFRAVVTLVGKCYHRDNDGDAVTNSARPCEMFPGCVDGPPYAIEP